MRLLRQRRGQRLGDDPPTTQLTYPSSTAPALSTPSHRRQPDPAPASVPVAPAPHPFPAAPPMGLGEASAAAAAFACDYLSWDQDDPVRRGTALAGHAGPGYDERALAMCGWSGRGRQRADLALPGRIQMIGHERVVVHVRVRVTSYVACATGADPVPRRSAEQPFPSSAPAVCAPGWRSTGSSWYELLVPLVPGRGREPWAADPTKVWVVPPLPPGAMAPGRPA